MIPGTHEPVAVYCDMETASGGWTLVWSYGFTDYENFNNPGNAVLPIPSSGWISGPDSTNVNVSKVIPTDPNTHGALEFALWKHFGREFLVRSNINNDIACSPGTGSLVDSTTGTVSCTLIYDVVQNGCIDVPVWYEITDSGTHLRANIYAVYVWTGSTDINWPAHEPCGMNQPTPSVCDLALFNLFISSVFNVVNTGNIIQVIYY